MSGSGGGGSGVVYIAHPIDQAQRSTPWAQDWLTRARDQLTLRLNDHRLTGYWPGRAFSVPQQKMTNGASSWHESDLDPTTLERIQHVNEHALAGADGLIVLWPAGMPSAGIAAEINQALDAGLPVAFISDTMTSETPEVETFRTGRLSGARATGRTQLVLAEAVDWIAARIKVVATRGPGPSLTVVRHSESASTPEPENTEPADAAAWAERVAAAQRLKVKLLHPDAKLPTRGYDDDAGLDLYVSQRCVIPAGHTVDVPVGIAVEPPSGIWLRIVGRSSTLRKRDLLVNEGIIDPGWRGELFVCVHNVGETSREVGVAERIAQIIPTVRPQVEVCQVDELSEHPRGTNGFGSTGS